MNDDVLAGIDRLRAQLTEDQLATIGTRAKLEAWVAVVEGIALLPDPQALLRRNEWDGSDDQKHRTRLRLLPVLYPEERGDDRASLTTWVIGRPDYITYPIVQRALDVPLGSEHVVDHMQDVALRFAKPWENYDQVAADTGHTSEMVRKVGKFLGIANVKRDVSTRQFLLAMQVREEGRGYRTLQQRAEASGLGHIGQVRARRLMRDVDVVLEAGEDQ